ncbi:hypothetical protein Ccar_07020 [Clostridium carboxidivorans P7]|uniref:Uncharacterized protein n=1 Tax=Clostridium carboxidivorans P7 TaxID=536227 RepID=C6PSL6_9CLOT|nr:hypothetical protein [Clostridium carboxidivorans]AKN30591.1 hypothetical protein Ccar_07020 [Clostridium carboxidivorans P7]EET87790.1 conserved hypothetical protein [Clostridium carboxidivorans P7]EFG86342.1 hypothetical protein CLCAR_4168 [Clostridium carboxidivorans P7]
MKDLETDCNFKIIIPDAVQNEMKERLILCEDVKKTIINAQENKERFLNTQNSHYLTRMRIDSVTYWVEYEEKNNELLVHNVYTHRMEIVEN